MCGISGLAALEGALAPEVRAAVRPMTDTLAHRGPDGAGFFADAFVALGHRRLAIIDREGGHQPLANENNRVWIVFNGEIYNHRGLRRQLVASGHTFRSDSDTEAIVHAYEEWGADCVTRLHGMFAFALYDQARRELFLARDRVGKKPLFYALCGGVLHFASEVRAFYQSPLFDDTFDTSAIEEYLSLGYLVAPRSAYRSVRKLEPGHWLRLRDGRVEIRQYWDIGEFDTDTARPAQVITHLEQQLLDVVHDRLESEVPLGAFLSGGIDSGLVVSFMAQAAAGAVTTASVGFADGAHNELEAAGVTAAAFHTRHYADLIEPRLDDVLDTIAGAFDEPFADASAVPTYFVSQSARRHVTVALSGDGGDETFGGYDFRYVPHALECAVRPWIPGALGPALASLGRGWPRSPRLPQPLRLGTILENLSGDATDAYFADLCFLKPRYVRQLLGLPALRQIRESPVYDKATAAYRRCASPSPLQRAQYADFKVYLPNDVLVKVDRMSMRHGLEVRCPLLDHRVAESAFRLPSATKMPHLRAKHLLREVAQRRLPEKLLSLPKHGFTAPVDRWMQRDYARQFADDVFAPNAAVRDLLDLATVRQWFTEHGSGRRRWGYALWAVWMLERWNRTHSELRRWRAPVDARWESPRQGAVA